MYKNAYNIVNQFIESDICRKNWRKMELMFKDMGITLLEYSKNPNLNAEGYCTYHKKTNKFFILLDKNAPEKRKTFTKHHEFGHIVSGHHFLYPDTIHKSSNSKTIIEREATIVGRNIFIPAIILNNLIEKIVDISLIKSFYCEYYDISNEYFENRYKNLKLDLQNINYPNWYNDEIKEELKRFYYWAYISNIKIEIPLEFHPEYECETLI